MLPLGLPPVWMLWTPLALWVGVLVFCAVALPRYLAPAIGFVVMGVLAFARLDWLTFNFGLALTVGAITLGATTRAGFRPGTAVWMSVVPLVAWVTGVFAGPERAALESAVRAASQAELNSYLPYVGKMNLTAAQLQAFWERGLKATILLLPAMIAVQSLPLMAWGYRIGAVILRRGGREVESLPQFSQLRLPAWSVWVLCLGLLLLAIRQGATNRLGINLSAGMAMAYLAQGLAVLTFMAMALRAAWLTGITLLAIWLLWPFFMIFTCVLGVSDVWLDYRKLEPWTVDSE